MEIKQLISLHQMSGYIPNENLQQNLFVSTPVCEDDGQTLTAGQRKVLALIGYETMGVDELVQHSGLPVAQVMAALSALELEGKIARSTGGYIHC